MKKYSFLTSASRENTNAEKYTMRQKLFDREDILPLWVADMDINIPKFVLDAIKKRLKHPIFGYEEIPQSAFMAQINWAKRHYNFEFIPQDILYLPSVVASIKIAIEAFSSVGDKVIVQTPVYAPFFKSITQLDREVIYNPLKSDENGYYTMDTNDLKSKIDKKTKLLLLCSPHNPVGRVWRRDELLELIDICKKNDITIFSDEIHCDITFENHQHTPLSLLNSDISLVAMGVGKSFNMAGFGISSVIIKNETLKERFLKVYNQRGFGFGSTLSHIAFEVAYNSGDVWLNELKEHLWQNYLLLKESLEDFKDLIKLTPQEGTYLAWLDCRNMGLNDKQLRDFFAIEAKLGVSLGVAFGKNGSGFVRLNFAVSKRVMKQVVRELKRALFEYKLARV